MTRNETFNGLRQFLNAGVYFELLSTVNPVDVFAYDDAGVLLESESQVSQGFVIDRRDQKPFDRIEIRTGANEAVKFLITDGLATNRSVPADTTDRAARLLGVIYGTLGQFAQVLIGGVNAAAAYCYGTLGAIAQVSIGGVNTQISTDRGFAYSSAYKSSTAMAANTADTIFSAASNTNGAIVWAASFFSHTGGTAGAVFLAKTSAPANTTDGDAICAPTSFVLQVGGVSQYCGGQNERAVFIPAGKGLYAISGALETVAYRKALYTLL